MPDQKISAMTAAVSVSDADLVPIVQAGLNKRATVGQILEGVVTELDPTLEALAALDSSAGYLKQTAADTFSKVTEFAAADMAALRTFVRPVTAASILGGGFYSCAMFQFTLDNPDAVAGQIIATVKIVEATDSGAFYFEAPVLIYRDPANGMSGSIPAGLIRTQYTGSPGTGCSLTAAQLNFNAPDATTALIVSVSGFVSPTVSISARLQCPGDAVVTIL